MSNIHYLPVIESSPTELSTVKQVLNDTLKMAEKLHLKTATIVFDQAIYAKAQEIV